MIIFILVLLCCIVPLWDVLTYGKKVKLQYMRVSARQSAVLVSILSAFTAATLVSCIYLYQKGAISADTEVINGYVTSMKVDQRDCKYPGWHKSSDDFCTNESTRRVLDHYERRCSKDANNKEHCTNEAVYRTEYKYEFPWEKKYYVYSTLDTYQIERVDEQGAIVPPRFAIVKQFDPVSKLHSYKNRLLLAGSNILNPKSTAVDQSLLSKVPPYPSNLYDHYKINRFVSMGVPVESVTNWNTRIAEVNANIGPNKQANLVVVLTKESSEIREAIYYAWNGGKKNDVIVVLGIHNNVIEWSDVITFLNNQGNEYMVAELNEYLTGMPLDISLLDNIQTIIIKKFDRTAMESIKYIEDTYTPSAKVFFLALLAGLFINAIFAFILRKVK